jgi:hypothetical protein
LEPSDSAGQFDWGFGLWGPQLFPELLPDQLLRFAIQWYPTKCWHLAALSASWLAVVPLNAGYSEVVAKEKKRLG